MRPFSSSTLPRPWILFAVFVCLAPMTASGQTPEGPLSRAIDWFDSVDLIAGGYVHFTDSDDYDGPPILGGIEAAHKDTHRFGISLFNNSFGQFSQYYYYGYKWKLPFISENTHFKLTGGVLHGYKGQFKDKVPFNISGWSPAVVPSIGWKRDRVGVEVSAVGTAGVLFTMSYQIWER